MSFGKRLLEARKDKGLSQEDVAKYLNTKGPAIGRYERDEMKPSIEIAGKLAILLDVSLDFLVGQTDVNVDSQTLKRVIEIQALPEEDKSTAFKLLDAFLRDAKTRQAYAS
jgi:transcriptional regulator with XRE-family HTH domain